ncbi:ABC transporter ATP-binding protein [Flexithrix dorotheae]|uniref:ABC transporter ATP-binding protein n=1 Tax=Flexithrix dorotheae TaxID=70993 RepID=UPI00035E0126|nr:ABC transporter ATP-binding protein [Flexithrix dorotheae]
MISIKNLRKVYNESVAVDNISFEIKEGETLVLLGKSGSGKTTTLKMINRLIEPSSGDIFFDDENILQLDAVKLRRQIGYVIQENALFPHYSVGENISVVPKLLGWDATSINKKVNELLQLLELAPEQFIDRYPNELSGGQQQRVAIARALAGNPRLVLMDEPFGALDPLIRNQVRESFLKLKTHFNFTVVMVTHDISEAIKLGDKICLMDHGKIVQMGTSKALVFSPDSPYVLEFFTDNKFQFELNLVNLADLMPFLNHNEYKAENPTIAQFPHNMNFYELMQEYAATSIDKLAVQLENGENIQTTISELLEAFRKYKIAFNS